MNDKLELIVAKYQLMDFKIKYREEITPDVEKELQETISLINSRLAIPYSKPVLPPPNRGEIVTKP